MYIHLNYTNNDTITPSCPLLVYTNYTNYDSKIAHIPTILIMRYLPH